MYEVSCRDLGVVDCEFNLMAYSLERLVLDVLAHARFRHSDVCPGADAPPGSSERLALHARITAAAHEVAAEELLI